LSTVEHALLNTSGFNKVSLFLDKIPYKVNDGEISVTNSLLYCTSHCNREVAGGSISGVGGAHH